MAAVVVARRPNSVTIWLEGLGRLEKRPVAVLKRGIARFDGQLIDTKEGVVLGRYEAYETVRAPVLEEPLGSVLANRRFPYADIEE